MTLKKINFGLINYGAGNIASVVACFKRLGYSIRIIECEDDLPDINFFILPGVGAFPRAIEFLRGTGLSESLVYRVRLGTPIIGICLGMHLMATKSLELGNNTGLNLIPGRVVPNDDSRVLVGWRALDIKKNVSFLSGVNGQEFYFNNTYRYVTDVQNIIANVEGSLSSAAIVKKGSALGVQFHPEKSQRNGIDFIKMVIENSDLV